MNAAEYLSTPEWKELVVEPVLGRPTKVWKKRLTHVLDMLDLVNAKDELELLVQGDRRITFGGFRNALEVGAAELERLGVNQNDRVLIVLYNSSEFLLAQWTAWRLGAVPVLGNRWWSEAELAEVVARVRPSLIVTDMALKQSVAGGAKVISPADVAAWWGKPSPSKSAADPRQKSSEDDLAIMVFTAGSTGVPKGVQLSHRNLIWTQHTVHIMRGGRPATPQSMAEQKVALVTTPMFHNGAVVAGITALIDGNRMVFLKGRFDPEEAMKTIQDEKVVSWSAVPTMFSRLLQHPALGKYDISSLMAPATGGTMVSMQLLDLIRARAPKMALGFSVGYGMTEMSFLTMALAAHMDQRPGTVGKAIPAVELKIDNPDANGEGEIIGRSGALMIGYFGSDDQPIDAEGWYHTGDVGRFDQDGFLYITGRIKDMIIRGGENIACPHVEDAIIRHPDVEEVAVIGYPDEELGEKVAAVVQLRPGSTTTAQQLAAFCKERLAYFEVPSQWVFRDDALPTLPTGKIDKRTLMKELTPGLVAGKHA